MRLEVLDCGLIINYVGGMELTTELVECQQLLEPGIYNPNKAEVENWKQPHRSMGDC